MATSQHPWGSITAEADSGSSDLVVGAVRLLAIDRDEVAIARLTSDMRPLNHMVSAVASPEEAAAWLERRPADLLVLFADTGGSALDGAQYLRATTELPLIVVGPDATAENRVGAFDRGAEDYIARPVFPAELDRRVRVLVRRDRLRHRSDELNGPEGLVMHVRSHEAYVGATRLTLTPKEFAILHVLLSRRGEVVAPDQMSLEVWGYETFGSRNFVEAHISRLRRKLARAGTVGAIKTVRGIGYAIR